MGVERDVAARRAVAPDTKPEIVLRPSELWEYHKDRLEWLRKQRDQLVSRCKHAAWDAIAHRIPDPATPSEGDRDTWNELDDAERERLYASILDRLVESSGSSREFVLKLLPQPLEDYVLDAVDARRQPLDTITIGEGGDQVAALGGERSYATGDPVPVSSHGTDDSVLTIEVERGDRQVST